MSISTITSTIAVMGGGAGSAPIPAAAGAIPPVDPVTSSAPLKPAVQFSIRTGKPEREGSAPDAETAQREARIRIDTDTRTIVYQEVDPASGDVVIQLPDPVVLKARAYADRAAAQAAVTHGASTSTTLDRTA